MPCVSDLTGHFQVAVLDIDICGPSIPRIMGLEGEQVSCRLVANLPHCITYRPF